MSRDDWYTAALLGCALLIYLVADTGRETASFVFGFAFGRALYLDIRD